MNLGSGGIGNWALSLVIPLALHLGVEAVLHLFPHLPPVIVSVLKTLEGAKADAASLSPAEQAAAIVVARTKAAAEIVLHCKGVDVPPEMKTGA